MGELIFRGAYYWREFCVSKWAGLDNTKGLKHKDMTAYNNLKQPSLTVHRFIPEWGEGSLLSEGYLRLRFGGNYFWEGLFLEGLIIGILRYVMLRVQQPPGDLSQ